MDINHDYVSVEGKRSKTSEVFTGVPQGTVLGLVLLTNPTGQN
jgi:hypothetical protein